MKYCMVYYKNLLKDVSQVPKCNFYKIISQPETTCNMSALSPLLRTIKASNPTLLQYKLKSSMRDCRKS